MKILPLGMGKCSFFGGPLDTGVAGPEGLGCVEFEDLEDQWFRRLFLTSERWDDTKGLARNLNPGALYLALRFAYGDNGEMLSGFTREQVRRGIYVIEANDKIAYAQAADWGPNLDTGRLVDLSPGVGKILGVTTDDVVSVTAIL